LRPIPRDRSIPVDSSTDRVRPAMPAGLFGL